MTRQLKSDHAKATEALQAAQRRHDKAREKAENLHKAAAEAEIEARKAKAALHYISQNPALADEDTAGDGGEMAAT